MSHRCGIIFTSLIMALLLTTSVALQPQDDLDRVVTLFTIPLRDHHRHIRDLHQQAGMLRTADVESQACLLFARKLHQECLVLQQLMELFFDGQTRRGTLEELDLAKTSMSLVSEATQRVFDVVKPDFPREPLDDDMKRRTFDWALAQARFETIRRMKQHGLHALFDDFHFESFAEKAVNRLIGPEATLRQEIEQFAFSPMHRLDRKFAEELFLRQKSYQLSKFILRDLVIDLSGHGLVIRVAEQFLWNLTREVFWPMLRKEFRTKGNLEERVRISIATMRASAKELNLLASGMKEVKTLDDLKLLAKAPRDPAAFPLQKAVDAINAANGRIKSTDYLMQDLAREQREALALDMLAAGEELNRAINLAKKRFLLHRDEERQALLRDFQEYKACVRFLERLIRYLERKESPREYFITHFNQLESERLVPRGRPCGVSSLQAIPQFQYVDKRQVEGTRQQLLAAGKKTEDFNPYSQLKRWEPTHYLLTIKHQGRTYYEYVAVNASASDRREYGNMGVLFGLDSGSIPFTLDVVTYDDRHFTFKYTLVVELGKEADNVENAVNNRRQQLDSARSRIRLARTPQDQRRAELDVLNLLMNYTTAFKGSRAATPEKLHALLSEIFQLYTDLRTPVEVNSHRKVGISLLQECVSLADAQANALAKKVLLQLNRYYGDAMPPEAYVSMANLAVAHQGDLAAARHYSEKAIEQRDALGFYQKNKELKLRDLDLLPRTPFPAPAVPASP